MATSGPHVSRAVQIRPALRLDQPFLRDRLHAALFVLEGSRALPRSVLRRKALARYVSHWGKRPGDVGVVALADHRPIGAAWLRRFDTDHPGYGFVAETIPELTMPLSPTTAVREVGRRMLACLQEQAVAISLSCDPANPAQRLYRRCGFEWLADGRRMLWTQARPL